MTMPKFTDDITCSDCHTPRMEVGRIGEEWVCWSCTIKRVESTRQQLAEARAAARWIYYEFNQLTDDGANIPLRWPWLAEEQNGGTDAST